MSKNDELKDDDVKIYEADERLRIMFSAVPLCICFWTKELKVIDCNSEVIKLFELSGKRDYLDRFYELSPDYQPDGRKSSEKAIELVKKAFKDGYCRFEWTHSKLDGELIPCEITLIRVEYNNDFIVVGYTRDLREYKRMIEKIQKRGNLLDTINHAATVLLEINDEKKIVESFRKCMGILGEYLNVDRVQIWRNETVDGALYFVLEYTWLSDIGKKCKIVPEGVKFPYADRPGWEDLFLRNKCINSSFSDLSDEDKNFLGGYDIKSLGTIPFFLQDKFWGLFSIENCHRENILSDEELNAVHSIGFMIINAISRNLQAVKLREADEHIRIMLDAAPIACSLFDVEGNLIDCNRESLKLFGLSSKREYKKRILELSPEFQPCGRSTLDMRAEFTKKAVDEGSYRFEWLHLNHNGEPIPAEVTLVSVTYKNELVVSAYIRDLRELNAMINEMRKAEIAEQSNKIKSKFLATMSHEIRTPMNAILGITEILLQNDNLLPDVKDALNRIYTNGDFLLHIINEILDLSKIESGKMTLMSNEYFTTSLINDVVQSNIIQFKNKPIEFKLEVDENIPMKMFGDGIRIKQILNNLLSNAFKYTEEGEISLSISMEPGSENSGIVLVFRVKDTGSGIADDQMDRVFDDYVRLNLDANRAVSGIGLGMGIARELVHLMNGEIFVKSKSGKGTEFTVKLPQKDMGYGIMGKELTQNLQKLNFIDSQKRVSGIMYEPMPYGKILIVDDSETNLYVAKGLMLPYRLLIDTAMSGFEAIDKIKGGVIYDIIFVDHMMPKMDGMEAVKIIRGLGYTNPIVAFTANAVVGQEEIFLQSGFDAFVSKPIDIRQLNLVLNKFIRDKQPPEMLAMARKQKFSAVKVEQMPKSNDAALLTAFIYDAKKSIAVLESVLKNINDATDDDLNMFAINAHAMKSALFNIGETELSKKAFTLEQAGKDRDITLITEKTGEVVDSIKKIAEKIEVAIKKKEAKVDSEDTDYLYKQLELVKAACIDYNEITAESIITNLKRKRWTHTTKESIDKISEYLLHSDFEEVVQKIEEIIAN